MALPTNRMIVIKADKSEEFIKEFNKNAKLSKFSEFLDKLEKTNRLFHCNFPKPN